MVRNQLSDEFSDGRGDGISEAVKLVADQPKGNAMSHSIHRGFR